MARTHFQLPVGDLVGKSLSIYFRNLIPFTVMTALVLSPWIALTLYLAPASVVIDPITEQPVFRFNFVALGMFLLQTLLGFMLAGSLTFGVVQQLRGQPAGILVAVSQGMQSFARVLGTSFLCGLRILAYFLLLYVPGIIEQVKLYVAVPAAVMEGKGASASVERSIRLTDGSRWHIFGAWLLVALLGIGLGLLVGVTVAMAAPDFELDDNWLAIGIQLFMAPFAATMSATAYFLLRKGKENIDAREIAAVFD